MSNVSISANDFLGPMRRPRLPAIAAAEGADRTADRAGQAWRWSLPDVAAKLASRDPLLAFVVISRLGIGTICQSGVLRRSEQAALAAAREVVVTSPATAKLVAAYYGRPTIRGSVVPRRDGCIDLSPVDPLDGATVSAVNVHQRIEKGLGRR